MPSETIRIRPLIERDVGEADRIVQLAFGTFLGDTAPPPADGASYVTSRWAARPNSAFAIEFEGRLIGSNFVTRWGSFGFFGPMTLDPEYWGRGFANTIVDFTVGLFDRWHLAHAGLFTMPDSPRHLGLYQKFGFRPRALTLILERPITGNGEPIPHGALFSRLDSVERAAMLESIRGMTDRIFPGLDPTPEVEAVYRLGLGDTVLVTHNDTLAGFAVCHSGPGTEAGAGVCYIKVGAVVSGEASADLLLRLVDRAAAYGASRGATRLVSGVNSARTSAYECLLNTGFRIGRSGIAMHRPNAPGFSRPGDFVLDDWR